MAVRDNVDVTIPNVLAQRYPSAELVRLWTPEHKIVLERQLWIAVLRAQAELGVDFPSGAIEASKRRGVGAHVGWRGSSLRCSRFETMSSRAEWISSFR